VVKLVEAGRITAERYETYLELLDEVEAAEIESRSREWRD
jgi:putative ribosome biogenesis GTPase RsgA